MQPQNPNEFLKIIMKKQKKLCEFCIEWDSNSWYKTNSHVALPSKPKQVLCFINVRNNIWVPVEMGALCSGAVNLHSPIIGPANSLKVTP